MKRLSNQILQKESLQLQTITQRISTYTYTTESRQPEKCHISEHLKEYKSKYLKQWQDPEENQADKKESLKE